MISKSSTKTLRDYVADLAARGRYCFGLEEAREVLGISPNAARLAVNRMVKAGVLASPARGFYVTVPPEYRGLGCAPPDQFLPQLMEFIGQPYYVGLLSAAQYYGAAHQRPQEFQVMLGSARRAIRCGRVRVAFMLRKDLKTVPVQTFNTQRGTIAVSTPEATALDLVGYPRRVGGLDQIVAILAELEEQLDGDRLACAAASAPVSWSQRLGYLLDWLNADSKTGPLHDYVRAQAHEAIPLQPGDSRAGAPRNAKWKIWVSAEPEADQ
jgi:predicted transcriptional regulator of viral defense system